MAKRNISRLTGRFGWRVPRLVIDGNGAVETPFHIAPQADPTGTAAEGDITFSSAVHAPRYYDGSAFQTVAALGAATNAFTGNVTVAGSLTYRRPVTSFTTASPTALTAADSGTQYNFNRAAGVAVVLPAVTAAEVGVFYDFFFETTATGDHTITAQAGDLIVGGLRIEDFDTANTGTAFFDAGGDDLIITMNGTTKGGKRGSWLRLTCSSATSWTVQGNLFGDGTLVTPFS